MQNVVWPTVVAMATIFGKFGLFLHKIAYNSACMVDRLQMFGPTGEGATREPTLVAMATSFGLGVESTCLPACLSTCYFSRRGGYRQDG